MSSSTFSTTSVPPVLVQNCFICSCEIIPFSVNKNEPHLKFSEFAKNNGKVCELFCRIASRYLNFKCGNLKPEETISVSGSNDADDNHKHLLCKSCFPLAKSLCEIYHEFKYFEQFFHWRMKEVIDSIQAQMEKFVYNSKKNCEFPEKQKYFQFRRKFINRGRENFAVKDFPKLQLARVTKHSPKEEQHTSNENSENYSQLPQDNAKNVDEAGSDFNLYVNKIQTPDFKCLFCLKVFASLHFLTIHEKAAHYKCDVCGRMFNKSKHLSQHKRTVHSVESHQCLVCLKIFRQARYLKIHQNRNSCKQNQTKPMTNSTGIKLENTGKYNGRVICKYCGKSVAKYYIKRHEMNHTSNKPYKCKVCGRAHGTQAQLNSHARLHSGVKPYECAICGMKFRHNFSFRQHGKLKHPGEEYDKQRGMNVSFKCGFCNKVFKRLAHKVLHERSHNFEKPYQCIFCKQRFKLREPCNKHQQKCHGYLEPQAVPHYNEAHVDAVAQNLAGDEEVMLVKVDVSGPPEFNSEDIHHHEDRFILPD